MKKLWNNGVLLIVISILILSLICLFGGKINVANWPFPTAVSGGIMALIFLLPICGFLVGYIRFNTYIRQKKAAVKKGYNGEAAERKEKAPVSNPAVKKAAAEGREKAEETGTKTEEEKAAYLKENFKDKTDVSVPEEMLDDVSFIRDMHHEKAGAWEQYDFLLAARAYGWDYMLSTADYMAEADLENIGTVTVAEMANMQEKELIGQYQANGGKISQIPELVNERGQLAVGGMSKALNFCPTKVVWFNQTKIIRVFSIIDDDQLMLRYAESVIRRNFGTPDAMKLAKPVPAEKH